MLGYLSGFVDWVKFLPWMETVACGPACANLRSAFTISAILCLSTVLITVVFTEEERHQRPLGFSEKTSFPRFGTVHVL